MDFMLSWITFQFKLKNQISFQRLSTLRFFLFFLLLRAVDDLSESYICALLTCCDLFPCMKDYAISLAVFAFVVGCVSVDVCVSVCVCACACACVCLFVRLSFKLCVCESVCVCVCVSVCASV